MADSDSVSRFTKVVKTVVALNRASRESESAAHLRLREQCDRPPPGMWGFTTVSQTGVIYVMGRAREQGFYYGNEEWANLGQGAPEVGKIPDAPPRPTTATWDEWDNEYAPVAGIQPLREAVAALYNARYRVGKKSQYTFKNVCITPGGRAALSRLAAAIGSCYVGYFLPEYTAYEQVLTVFKNFVPLPFPLHAEQGYNLSGEQLRARIEDHGLGVVALSNPCNPTGHLIEGEQLQEWVSAARDTKCSIVFDEFYSSYIWSHGAEKDGRTVSSAAYIEDVNEDPILIVDGLTKNWRVPGWRICWAVGPEKVVEAMASAGSFLEGGANHPLQKAALPLLDPEFARQDTIALQKHFRAKRAYVLKRLEELGFSVPVQPMGTFYVWVNLENLPYPLDNGLGFFEEGLKERVICVPGIFFDVNPGKRRELFHSPYHHYVRLSLGPELVQLERGMAAFERILKKFQVATPSNDA
mmetsp:Transcript_13149/g.33559  ORF Transcript_13149/g.33559 Transcript_13149/m.33559 type:complete len:469 (-) Transcript_13149:177-1583(-)